MTTENQDWTMWSGDTKEITVSVTTDGSTKKDLTGASIKWQLAKKVTASAVVTKEVDSGITLIDASSGAFRIDLSPSDTAALKGSYYHECEVIDNASTVETVFVGTVTINRDLVNS